MKILIARHGQDLDNEKDILNGHRDMPLTRLGEQQGRIAGRKLKNDSIKIDVILCSPLQRAKKTAEIIAEEIDGPKPIIENKLIERDFGILTGKNLSDIPKYSKKTLQTDVVNYFLEADGAEDFPSLYNRAQEVLAKVERKYPDKTVLLVAHGDIGKMIRAAFHGWNWMDGLQTKYFDNSEILFLDQKKDRIE